MPLASTVTARADHDLALVARSELQTLRASSIREVANAAMGRADVLPFWFGEPHGPTPEPIRAAAIAALQAGDTLYVQTLGLPDLRAAIADYVSAWHRPVTVDNIAVTSSGTAALMATVQAIVGPGDRVVAITPLWPNLVEMPKVLCADVMVVPLEFRPGGWELDLGRLLDALTPGTRALLVNSPNNPTGWTMSRGDQRRILDHCRRHGIWIIEDCVYERIVYDGGCAPGFLGIAEPGDRVVSCNSFSKAWRMTGWRLGWVVAPAPLLPAIGKLIEYSTTCAPPFVQRAGLVALTGGGADLARMMTELRAGRDLLATLLAAIPGVETAAPAPGAMYTFFRVAGLTDSLDLCKRLVTEAGLGLAPGIAFGPEGEGCLRWCFAAGPEQLREGARRLTAFLGRA